jgi:hypothetical protein
MYLSGARPSSCRACTRRRSNSSGGPNRICRRPVGADDAEHQQDHSARGQDGTQHVRGAAALGGLVGGDAPPGQGQRDSDDRDVDEHDPFPAGVLGEHTADQDAEGTAGGVHRTPDVEGLHALLAAGEGRGRQRRRGRGQSGGSDALHGASGHQMPGACANPPAGEARPNRGSPIIRTRLWPYGLRSCRPGGAVRRR